MTPVLLTSPRPALAPIEDATRREFITSVGAAALAAAFLAACGEDEGDATPEAAMRTIDDYFGPVTIPMNPQRVVTGDITSLAIMVALETAPVASFFFEGVRPTYLGPSVEEIPDVTGEDGVDIERALTFDPDLLLTSVGFDGSPYRQEHYDRVRQAMPTYGWMPSGSSLDGIKENVVTVAKMLGRQDRGDELIRGLDAHVAELRDRATQAGLHDINGSQVIRIFADSIQIRSHVLLAELGLEFVRPAEPRPYYLSVSLEQVNQLNDIHTLFIMVNPDAAVAYADLQASPVWQALEPVKNNRAQEVDFGLWQNVDPVAVNVMLNDIERLLISPAERR